LKSLGYKAGVAQPPALQEPLPQDFDERTIATIEAVAQYTMTSAARIFALCEAVRYVVKHRIQGDIVECGVWRGGSMMAVARTLLESGDNSRALYLFDTFEGMVEPGEMDVSIDNVPAVTMGAAIKDDGGQWCFSPVEEVRSSMQSTGYDQARIHLIKGRVEDTVPWRAPERIAILRLDTDWYESTRHELVHLFPRIVDGGVLIVDDYGFWRGCREAVDEYFVKENVPILLNRIDGTGRIAVVRR
jgi:O-methyltransferase